LSNTVNDKRAHERFTLWFPIRVDNPSGKLEAVCRDASAGGVLISGSRSVGTDIQIGEAVMVTVPGRKEGEIFGRVVRLEGAAGGEWRMAIEFIHPVPELEILFKRSSSLPPAELEPIG
jgi:hypothetical protein